jgi:hypothetical protein
VNLLYPVYRKLELPACVGVLQPFTASFCYKTTRSGYSRNLLTISSRPSIVNCFGAILHTNSRDRIAWDEVGFCLRVLPTLYLARKVFKRLLLGPDLRR